MDLILLTYTSRCAPGLTARDVDAIHRAALTYNPLDGVTGLLVFNGSAFIQMIEGAESAIDDLMRRISADKRHHDLTIFDRRPVTQRFFPHWGMYRIDIDPSLQSGSVQLEQAIATRGDDQMRSVIGGALGSISKPA